METPQPQPYEANTTGRQPAQLSDKDARLWGMLCHLASFSGYVVPFGSIVGPLVVWLIKKNESPFVDANGKASLNFQISMTIYFLACLPLLCGGPLILLGWVPLGIADIVFTIIAAVKANNGESYKYPLAIPFLG